MASTPARLCALANLMAANALEPSSRTEGVILLRTVAYELKARADQHDKCFISECSCQTNAAFAHRAPAPPVCPTALSYIDADGSAAVDTAASFRATQRALLVAPGGLVERILALAKKQRDALHPYAVIPLVDLNWRPCHTASVLIDAIFAELYARGFSRMEIASTSHCWERCAIKTKDKTGKCSTPEICGSALMFYW